MQTTSSPAPDAVPSPAGDAQERALLNALRAGDERAFTSLIESHGPAMRRVACSYVGSDAIADEVVQDTWAAVLTGLDRFEQRSSLRTWIFQILINRAKTQGARERRTLSFSSLDRLDEGPVVSPDRFLGPERRWPGHWATPPRPWQKPETRLLSLEARAHLRAALEQLPERQRVVVTLRDVEGMSADETCALLRVSPQNQRVLLHRGRCCLRGVLEAYVEGPTAST